jgi:DNA-binding response OmpR family regulator
MPESILIVEDEPALQDTLAYNLKKEGYTVESVGDGRAALESARRLKPDQIVSCFPKWMGLKWRASFARR